MSRAGASVPGRRTSGAARGRSRRRPKAAHVVLWVLGGVFIVGAALAAALVVRQAGGAASLAKGVMPDDGRQSIFILGDSFAENPHFKDQMAKAFNDRTLDIDGVGGSTLSDQHRRLLQQMDQWTAFLIILDGGLDDTSAVRPVADMVSLMDRGCGRWLYIEPPHSTDQGVAGSPVYRRQTALVDAVRRRWPSHVVELIEPLKDASDGSAGDWQDVAAGWTPRSLRQKNDPVHLNAQGNRILVETIASAIARVEASSVAACAGPTPEQVQSAANAQ